MHIRVVAKRGDPPQSDADGQLIWTGGNLAASPDIAGLPASILAALNPQFEIGTWYPYTVLRDLLANLVPTDEGAWTTISIPQDGPERDFETKIEVAEESAARLICEAAIAYCDRLAMESLWLRID